MSSTYTSHLRETLERPVHGSGICGEIDDYVDIPLAGVDCSLNQLGLVAVLTPLYDVHPVQI